MRQQQRWQLVFSFACFLLSTWSCHGRPLVRTIQSTHEWDRLLNKHAEETGLPVIVDFYSDSCGPCRMMAPIFQKVAKKYLNKAVFVKVDTNAQYELSGRYQIRSLPTFQFFLGGRKVHQAVGGLGEQGLIDEVDSVVRQAEAENVVLTLNALQDFYKVVDSSKAEAEVKTVHEKCVRMAHSKTVKDCVGAPANQLARKLKKKYKSAPKLVPRFTEGDQKPKAGEKSGEKSSTSGRSSSTAGDRGEGVFKQKTPADEKPNLHLATKDQLMAELEKRLDEERDAQVENEDAAVLEEDPEYHRWSPSGYPEKLVIVGCGPAGWSAAIYGARSGLQPLVICPSLGGQLQGKGVDVENYPGVLNNQGPALVATMRKQAIHFGSFVEDDVVIAIRPGSPLTIETNGTGIVQAHAVVVATGAEANWLNVPGEWQLRGGGVSSCATCDGFLYAKKNVVVVGGGDAAMEDALVLARTSLKVTIIHRRDSFRASNVLAKRVLQHPNIQVLWNKTVQEIVGKSVEGDASGNKNYSDDDDGVVYDLDQEPQKVVAGVIVQNVNTGEKERLDCDAVFIAIGHTPSTSFLKGVVEFQESSSGYVKTKPGTTATSVPGIFAAGDVSDAIYRQAITSAGSGAAAALDAERYLSEHGLGTEQDDLEAELLAELSSNAVTEKNDAEYNVYEYLDAQTKQQFARESIKLEL